MTGAPLSGDIMRRISTATLSLSIEHRQNLHKVAALASLDGFSLYCKSTKMILTASGSPVGSEVFTALAVLVISFVVLLIIRYYVPLRTTPAYLLVPVFFALWLPACIVILMPVDLASSARTDDEATRGIWLPDRLLLIWWRITYWLTFTLTWYAMRRTTLLKSTTPDRIF